MKANICRRRVDMPVVSESQLGRIASPDTPVVVRWEGDELVSLVALYPKPFTPTIITSNGALHDDMVDTQLVQNIVDTLDFPAVADIVSAGWRTCPTAPATVRGLYSQVLGRDPAPAYRRTWITLRLDPYAVLPRSTWRGAGVAGVAQAAVAGAVRIAETLSSNGVDARTADTFNHYDELTGYRTEVFEQRWSTLRHKDTFTTVFSAPGGPDKWWSARAERTTTRIRIQPNKPPRSTVALTTVKPIERDPDGWRRLRRTQLSAWLGHTPITDKHHQLPIGSAGMLVGYAPDGARVYVPFDSAESVLRIVDPSLAQQVSVRAAAAGAVTEPDQFAWSSGVRTGLNGQTAEYTITYQPNMISLPQGRISLRSMEGAH